MLSTTWKICLLFIIYLLTINIADIVIVTITMAVVLRPRSLPIPTSLSQHMMPHQQRSLKPNEKSKYGSVAATHNFYSIAFETMEPINSLNLLASMAIAFLGLLTTYENLLSSSNARHNG